jgi:transcriptional regulator with XRE-family HTH domain
MRTPVRCKAGERAGALQRVLERAQIAPRFYFYLWKVEADVHPFRVTDERSENLAQLIAELKAEYGVSEPQIADAIGASTSAVNAWATGARGAKRGPRRAFLQALHEAYPAFSAERIFAAASRQAPGNLDPDDEARVLEIYRDLTDEQRRISEIQMRALRESNRSGQ